MQKMSIMNINNCTQFKEKTAKYKTINISITASFFSITTETATCSADADYKNSKISEKNLK